MTILMGVVANYPLALATGLGLNAFVAFSIASQMTWADAMGLVVLEGLDHPGAGAHRLPEAVFHAVPAQLKIAISRRHRPVHRADRLRRRRLRAPHPRRRRTPPSRCSSAPDGQLAGLAGRWSSRSASLLVIALCVRKVTRRDPDLDRRHHRARDRRRGDRARRPVGVRRQGQPERLEPQRAGAARTRSSTSPTSALLGQFSLFGSFERVGVVAARAVRLHADARRLLRHHGHDDRDRRRGRPARRGRHPAEHPADPGRRLARRRRRWRGRRLAATRPTSSPPPASARAPAPAWPAWSPALLFLLATFFAPLVAIIPNEAAVPALVLVGFLMMQQVKRHRLGRPRDRHPGVPDDRADAVHLLDHRRHRRRLPRLRADQGGRAARPREVHPLLWVVAALFVVYFAIDPITDWLS